MLIKNDTLFFTAALLSLLLSAIASGNIVPLVYLPGWMEPISLFLINRWILDGLLSLNFGTVPVLPFIILTSYSLILLFVLVLWRDRRWAV